MAPFFDVHGDPLMDPYTVLSLPHTATDAQIKKAYRMQMLQLHPDKLSPTLSDNSIADITERFHNVKDAYEFLISPVHLASRRLYMAKMASRRAEYERREAYMRRNGVACNHSATTSGGVSGFASGGGGAAGMAGSGMPSSHQHTNAQRHNGGSSYQMPPSGKNERMPRSKSEPDGFEDGGDRRNPHRGHRRSETAGAYRGASRGRTGGMHNSHHATAAKQRRDSRTTWGTTTRERNGYKSDSAGQRTKPKPSTREGRTSNKPDRRSSHRDKEKRQRGKSEPRHRHSEGEKKTSRGRKSKETTRDQGSREQERRRRAKSAPARYSSKNPSGSGGVSDNKYSNMKYGGKHNNLPREFFCPLTKSLMKDPVVDTEGNCYEREAIERWLRVQSSSPITNGHLTLEMLRPDKKLKREIYKATGKPRSKSQVRTKSRSTSPTNELVSGRVLIDSYLREISSKSKLSVSLDGMGICAFSYRRITFVIEVPITAHAGFMVYSSFDGETDAHKLAEKIDAWNKWLGTIGRHSRVSQIKAGQKTVFTLKGGEGDMSKCDIFQKTLEYFVEMSLKLHNLLHPMKTKVVENVCLTRSPVLVA